MQLFKDMSEGMVIEGLRRLREESESRRQTWLETLDEFYEGGPELERHLIQHPGEDMTGEYRERIKRLASPNPTARIVDTIADWVYGDEVQRTLGAGEAADETYQAILTYNDIANMQEDIGVAQVLHGDAWANVAWRQGKNGDPGYVKVQQVHCGDIWFQTDPDDAGYITHVVERRVQPYSSQYSPVYLYWVWSEDEYMAMDQNFKIVEPRQPNPYGVIPYVRWRGRSVPGDDYGISVVRDAVYLHRLLLNQISDLDRLVMYQAGSILYVRGQQEPRSVTGPTRAWWLGPEGEIGFAAPNANFPALSEYVDRLIDWIFQTCGVPVSVIRGEQASSGFELVVKYQSGLRIAQSMRRRAAAAERDLAGVVCAVGQYGKVRGLPGPDAIDPEATFQAAMLPADESRERLEDQLLVENGFMTKRDWIVKHRPDVDPDEYLELLKAEAPPKPQPFGGNGGGLFGSLLNPEPEDEGAEA